MSAKIMGRAWDLDLPHNQLLVLLALADHADHEGNNVYPSLGLVAWKTGYSEQQVRRVIRQLIDLKILIVVSKSPGRAIKYKINIDAGTMKEVYTPIKMSPLTKSNPLHLDTPDPLQNVTPTPDMPSAKIVGEPSVEPSYEPKSATAPPSIKFPRSINSYTAADVLAYQTLHTADMVALVHAWDGTMYNSITEFSTKIGRMYIEVHQELVRLNKPNTEYGALALFTKKKDAWKSNPLVTDMLLYVAEYVPKPEPQVDPNKPMTEWEHDWAIIQERQKKEAEQYGWS